MGEIKLGMEIKYIYGLTPLQEGMVFQKLISADSSSYHNQDAVWIEEKINLEHFKQALKLLVEKHEAIGASFVIPNSTGVPRQVFFQEREIECVYQETQRSDVESYIKEIKKADLKRGFDLQKDCLMRVLITYFAREGKYYVLVSHHHIIMDGWCMSIVFGDLLKYYELLHSGESYESVFSLVQNEKESSSKYIEYLKWLQKTDRKQGIQYWTELLEGYQNVAQIVPLNRELTSKEAVKELTMEFQEDECNRIRETGKNCNVTMNSVFEAAWGVLLQKYNYLDDVVFGKVVSGRNVPIRGVEQTVGLFINTIPCRAVTTPDMQVKDLLKKMQNQAASSTAYDFCPLFEIQKHTQQRDDLIKTLISFEYGDNYNELAIQQESTREETNFDVNLSFFFEHNHITVRLIYNPGKYTEAEMNRMLQYYKNLVLCMADQPDCMIGKLSVLNEDQKNSILAEFNGGAVSYPKEESIVTVFAQQVRERPDEAAVVFEEETLTYAQLNAKANQIAAELRRNGVAAKDRVVILSRRSKDVVIGILGILKLGAAYVPVDISYPEERRNLVISDCDPKAVLTCGAEVSAEVPVISLEDFVYQEEAEEICVPSKPEDIVYIIYTSGTSGTPKGVMVEQHSVMNLVFTENYANVNSKTRLLQTGQLAFDASTFEIWATLLHGGMLHIVKEDTLLNCQKLKDYIIRHQITGFFITTALFNQLVMEEVELFDSLDWVLFGGEKASEKCAYLLRKRNSSLTLYNIYGPTETTTFATCYPIKATEGQLSIGKAIPNAYCYVTNGDSLCGIGMAGELCIGGEGVARGYLNKQELTEQKFVKNPYGYGNMYRTGDLVRWDEDGNIEYLSRIDQQVKIRGFRIELGDIDNAIRKIDEVKDVFVAAREFQTEEKVICAYVVLGSSISASSITRILEEELPSYMIPKHIVFLEELPVTRNGKINMAALPEIEIQSEREYVEPRNEVEQTVADIFKEILGVEKVGATDSFFELGGDSIKAIRVVSKMRAASYELSVRDILKYHVVEEIAQVAIENSDDQYEQGEVTGEVVDTPVIREFTEKNMEKPWHYNQSIMVCVDTEEDLVICKVMDEITRHHDVLRSTYKEQKFIIHSFEEQRGYDFVSYDLKEDVQYRETMEKICDQIQASISLEQGPLVKTALFKTVEGSFLLICIHHLVVDGVSWRILMEDLNTAFSQIVSGEEVVLPAKTASFRDWSLALQEYASSDALKAELPYWKKTVEQEWPASYEKNAPKSTQKLIKSVETSVEKNITSMLMKDANRAYHTETRDLLIAAFVLALQEMTDAKKLVVGLEGHGREEIHKKIQIDRTVGWFTSIYPVLFEKQDTMERSIIAVKDKLRSIPGNGMGYGMLKKQMEEKTIPVLFNFLGEMDAEGYQNGGLSHYSTGVNVAEENVFCEFSITSVIEEKQLHIELQYDASMYQEDTIEQISRIYVEKLKEVAFFCADKKESRRTAADYTGNKIQQKDLEEIYAHYEEEQIQDIYPLTPLQEGLLFHNVLNRMSTNYVVQTVFSLPYSVDEEKMKIAFELLMARYDVLRTVMYYHNTSMPLQIVLKNREPEFQVIDLMELEEQERDHVFAKVKQDDIDRGFNLEEDSVIRMTLIRISEELYKMFFTIHHIVVDGWSLSLMFCNLFQYYSQLIDGASKKELLTIIEEERKQTGEYSQFIKWHGQQEKKHALKYWQEVLSGYEESATIEPMCIPEKTKIQMEKQEKVLGSTIVSKLKELSNKLHVTPNSILEMVWGFTLASYNNMDDVVFGKVVSGRDADVPDIEKMAGLFINTIPVRFSMKDTTNIEELIKRMQIQADSSRAYDYCGLTEIQRKLGLGSQLIQTVLVFQNFYVDYDKIQEGNEKGIVPEVESDREQLNYPISLFVLMKNEGITFVCLYDPSTFVKEEVKWLLEHVCVALEQVLDGSTEDANSIELITEQEREVINQLNNTQAEFPSDKVAIQLIEEQVARIPDETALVFHGKKLTYSKLNQAANKLAWKMKEYNIQADDFVVLLTQRSIQMMIGILATLKCGAAFVPIGPTYPEKRKDYIINDCKPKVILCYGDDYKEKSGNIPVIQLDEWQEWDGEFYQNPEITAKPEHAAYVLYTSGTTGRPKGVVIENRSIVNYMTINPKSVMWEIWQSGYRKIISITNYTFDIFMTESLVAFGNGFTVFLADDEEQRDAKKFASLCLENDIKVVQITPSCLRAFIGDPSSHKAIRELKHIILGGEKIEWNTIKLIGDVTDAQVYDAYGPTEATVYVTKYNIPKEKDATSVSIGKPTENIKTYIISKGKLCGIGVPGELYIAGVSLAREYRNNKEMTDEKFVQNIFGEGRMYRTGDTAKLRADGNIMYIGRMDDQVKIRGLRIELGEIDSVIREQDDIQDTAVILKKLNEEDSIICAYIISDVEIDIKNLTSRLAERLPDYMIPQYITQLPEIPVTESGKLDKRALPFEPVRKSNVYQKPVTTKEIILCQAVEEVLGATEAGVNSNFFEIGGDSLKAIRLISQLSERGYEVSLQNVMRQVNLGQLSQMLRVGANNKESMKITRYFIQDAGFELEEPESISMMQENQKEECLHILEKEIVRFDSASCKDKEYKEYPLNGMQKMSYNMGIRYFALQIPFCEEVDTERLSSVWCNMKKTYDVLGSSIYVNKDKKVIRIYHEAANVPVPYVDIIKLEPHYKKEFVAGVLSVMERFSDDSYYQESHAAVIPILVRFEEERYSLVIIGSHLVCDGFSFDIIVENLLEQYYSETFNTDTYSYGDILPLVQNQYATAGQEEIEEKLEIKKFVKTLENFQKTLGERKYETAVYQSKEHAGLSAISSEKRIEISRNLFVDALHHTFGNQDIPVGMLHMARKTKKQNLFQYVGEFLDIIPVVLSGEKPCQIEQAASNKQMFMEEHNVFFAGLLESESKILKEASSRGDAMLVYNNTGALSGTDSIQYHPRNKQNQQVLNCEISKEGIKFDVMVKEGGQQEMTEYLDGKLIQYLKNCSEKE